MSRRVVILGLVLLLVIPHTGYAQSISGTLRDADSRQPIPLGLVLMYTEAGDSIATTVTDGVGRFVVSSSEPGSFMLRAAALGYRETPAGVFELGDGGSMTVEYFVEPAPLPIDALMVEVDRPVLDHHLVRNGYVRRLQRGLGKFITPHDIEESSARSTESLMAGIQGVRVGMVTIQAGAVRMAAPHLGETVQIMGPHGGWCEPTVYLDGIRTYYDPELGFTLTQVAHLQAVEAIEIYRRPAEIPVEFGTTSGGAGSDFRTGRETSGCGVLVVWTKQGLGPGQQPEFTAPPDAPDAPPSLPDVETTDIDLTVGERIRVQVDRGAASYDDGPIVSGTFAGFDAEALILRDPTTERPRALGLASVQQIQVARRRGSFDALRRGAVAGTVAGLGTAGFLTLLCEFTCRGGGSVDRLAPALGVGIVVGALVGAQGPGTRWLVTPFPGEGSGARVSVSVRLDARRP